MPRSTAANKHASKPSSTAQPAPLAKSIARSAAAKLERIKQQALDDIAVVVRRKAEIAEAFYDIGEALTRLQRPGVPESVGCKGFVELCETKLDLSDTTAHQLIAIVTNLKRDEAVRMGQTRAAALVDLANATPAKDTAQVLSRRKLALPSGGTIDLRTATTRQIAAAAKAFRDGRDDGGKRGKKVGEQARAAAEKLQAALRKLGVEGAAVRAVAGAPGKASTLRIEKLAVTELPKLAKAVGVVTRGQ